MDQDIRQTSLYMHAEELSRRSKRPGSGLICDAAEICNAPDGRTAIFSGTLMERLDGGPTTRVCSIDLASGDLRLLTFGPSCDRSPKYSPDGRTVAFLSDRHRSGDFQLYLLDFESGAARAAAPIEEGWVEYLSWSPDGKRILLGVAGHGADISSGQGATTSTRQSEECPSWMPAVEAGDDSCRWRRLYVYDLEKNLAQAAGTGSLNVWEASWCGNTQLAAIASPGPSETQWYSATLHLIDAASGQSRQIYRPDNQLGWPSASPGGDLLAVVEAVCSDRWIVAGDLRIIRPATGEVEPVATNRIDITFTDWRSDRLLLVAGHRGFDTVVATYDAETRELRELWSSGTSSTGGRYVTVSGLGDAGDCTILLESFANPPAVATIHSGALRIVRPMSVEPLDILASAEQICWQGEDGLDLEGWLLRPHGDAPFATVMDIHGGPVWHWRPRYLGRSDLHLVLLLARGYALFLPNPRGSSGRGQEFARKVVGDMGGEDTSDLLRGLDHLVSTGAADPKRVGVTGGSYGGFMTSWLITQDQRFAAAVSLAQVSNHVTEHLVSNISHFVALFVGGAYNDPQGKYFTRSPVMHAQKAKTPTLNVCGALDRCTPPAESIQFHNALREAGVESVLLVYPEEGHGIRKLPAAIDYAARVSTWFERHMPAIPGRNE